MEAEHITETLRTLTATPLRSVIPRELIVAQLLTPYPSNINFNIILSTARYPKRSLSFRVSD